MAASLDASFTVSAFVPATCAIAGSRDPQLRQAALAVKCTAGTGYTVALDGGAATRSENGTGAVQSLVLASTDGRDGEPPVATLTY